MLRDGDPHALYAVGSVLALPGRGRTSTISGDLDVLLCSCTLVVTIDQVNRACGRQRNKSVRHLDHWVHLAYHRTSRIPYLKIE